MTSPMKRPAPQRRWLTTRNVAIVIGLIVLTFAVTSVKVVSIKDNTTAGASAFDAKSFALKNYEPTIKPYVESNAVDLATLLTKLASGEDPAKLGKTSGNGNATAFAVTFTAVAGKATPPVLPLTIAGVPAGVTVVMQIGPAMSGTAIRDVTGKVTFDQFTNQLDYQNAATALNDAVRSSVLDKLDAASLAGKNIKVSGAFLSGNPKFISIIPVSVEVVP